MREIHHFERSAAGKTRGLNHCNVAGYKKRQMWLLWAKRNHFCFSNGDSTVVMLLCEWCTTTTLGIRIERAFWHFSAVGMNNIVSLRHFPELLSISFKDISILYVRMCVVAEYYLHLIWQTNGRLFLWDAPPFFPFQTVTVVIYRSLFCKAMRVRLSISFARSFYSIFTPRVVRIHCTPMLR